MLQHPESQGMLITAVSHVEIQHVTLQDFAVGVRIKDWVDGLHFQNADVSHNAQPRSIFSSIEKPIDLIFD
jgi:hypothetical protein